MNDEELAEILKYSDPKILYVIDWNNSLAMLTCPFKAEVKWDIGSLKAREIVYIDEVKVTLELITVFVVKREAYFFYHFDISID